MLRDLWEVVLLVREYRGLKKAAAAIERRKEVLTSREADLKKYAENLDTIQERLEKRRTLIEPRARVWS
jgi:peptidoglycan hydrolase CwlO-like protein